MGYPTPPVQQMNEELIELTEQVSLLRADTLNLRAALEIVAKDCAAIATISLPDLRMNKLWTRALVLYVAGEARAAAHRGCL